MARRAWHGRAVHPSLELLIGQALGYGPVHASHARHADDGADGGLGDAQHTRALAQAIADSKAFSIAGGGDTLAAIAKFGIEDRVGYISTGGGAFLEVLEGRTLPAFEILERRAPNA